MPIIAGLIVLGLIGFVLFQFKSELADLAWDALNGFCLFGGLVFSIGGAIGVLISLFVSSPIAVTICLGVGIVGVGLFITGTKLPDQRPGPN
jgi:hypothetical protein